MAVNFQHPFQCVRFVEKKHENPQNLLIVTAGSKLYSYAAESGQRLAVWPQDVAPSNEDSSNATGVERISESQEPAEKKRKVTPAPGEAAEDSKPASQESGKPKTLSAWSTISLLATSSNGDYVVAVTLEDKCIRVFQLTEDGSFQQLSERTMPKRPSVISLINDDSTILCGDKFGDMYSLPLIDSGEASAPSRIPFKFKPDQPAATPLTVHSKRNLSSLEQQKRHYGKSEKTEERLTFSFKHQLLLGHVSLLTDVAYVSLDTSSGQKRSYILTADRDEHIRVSRGPPQAHIIENYCLGHTSFISKLCVPQWSPEYLISGGGDNDLLVWKWNEGRILHKVPLVDQASETIEVAVRGIWATSISKSTDPSDTWNLILVALDGSAQLFCYVMQLDGTLDAQAPIKLSGNILDVTTIEKDSTIIVSVDSVREAGSIQEWRSNRASSTTLIEAFRLKPGLESLEWEPTAEAITTNINSQGTSDIPATLEAKKRQELNDLLYSLGNLRKKDLGYEE